MPVVSVVDCKHCFAISYFLVTLARVRNVLKISFYFAMLCKYKVEQIFNGKFCTLYIIIKNPLSWKTRPIWVYHNAILNDNEHDVM